MSGTETCPIWGTPARQLAKGGNGDIQVYSWRTDGEYRITGTARSAVGRLTPNRKALLTTWVVDQHRSGDPAPLIDDNILDRVSVFRPLRWSQQKQRFFLLAISREFHPGSGFKTGGQVDDRMHQDTGAISAWTECRPENEMDALLRLLKEEGLINFGGSDLLTLTSKGFDLLESLELGGAPTTQAFVAMWFDPSMNDAYRFGFGPAIEDAGYRPLRVDQKEHSNKVDDEIIAEIRRSRFLVADFTCGLISAGEKQVSVARGGVYYEAGFAQGLGMPVIWTCRSECLNHVHFDTRQYNHIVWNTPDELRVKLLNRIRAVIQ